MTKMNRFSIDTEWDWESTINFANAASQLLVNGPSESLLSHPRLTNAQDLDDFWSSLAAARLLANPLTTKGEA